MEDYVSYEQAVKLKELGFDWKCITFYTKFKTLSTTHSTWDDYQIILENYNDDYIAKSFNVECSAPTLAQAQKWLREKGIFLFIEPLVSISFCVYKYAIDRMETIDRIESKPQFGTYEEALAKGLDEALKLLN